MRNMLAFVLSLLLFIFCSTSFAMADGVKMLGNMQIFVIQDRETSMDISLFKGPATAEQRAALVPSGKAPASMNAFLIKTEKGKIVLIDSGLGNGGKLVENLDKVAHVKPEDVDVVLLTHMHMDHIGGLVAEQQKVFPKAVIRVSAAEAKYWFSQPNQAPQATEPNKNVVAAKALRDIYRKQLSTPFGFAQKKHVVLPGITAIEAFGHTPGHTAYLLESKGERMFIIGDLIHAAALQFPLPDECASYDMDAAAAVASRKAILNYAAKNNIPIGGMHLPMPAIGTVKANGKGGFIYTAE